MGELSEHLRNFQEEFEKKHGRKMNPEELNYLDVAQKLLDSEEPEEPADPHEEP